jgi:hypothetical protein
VAVIDGLAGLPDDQFREIVLAALGRAGGPEVWEALTSPPVAGRTMLVLEAARLDVQGRIRRGCTAEADGQAPDPDWHRRAKGFLAMLDQREAEVNARLLAATFPPWQPARTAWRDALEALARAVTAHRDRAGSGNGSGDATLWGVLDMLTVPDGRGGTQPLTAWLRWLDGVRGNDACRGASTGTRERDRPGSAAACPVPPGAPAPAARAAVPAIPEIRSADDCQ